MKYDSKAAAARLKKEYDKIHFMAYFMIAMVVMVILVSAFRKFWLTLLFIAVTVILQMFVFRRMQKEYANHAVQENLRATVCPILNTDVVVMKGEELLSKEVIREAALVPTVEQSEAISLFAAVKGHTGTGQKRLEVITCDAAIPGHVSGAKVRAEIRCGNWIHILLPAETDYSFLVKEGRVLSDDGLPERFYKKLDSLESYTTGSFSMRIAEDTADVFLKDRFLAANFSARTEVTEKMIDWNPLPELEKVLDLVWTLM